MHPHNSAEDDRHHNRVDNVLMQNELLRQKGSHADNRQQEGPKRRCRRPKKQRGAPQFQESGEVAEPLTETYAFEHIDHGREARELGAPREYEKRREEELQ